MKGKIKWYNARKGYGFIIGEDGKEIFIHRSAITPETFLNEGDEVQFDTENSERGIQAKNVKKL